MSDTIAVQLFDVEIDRGRDVLTVAVPKHEVAVLKVVHGADRVRVLGESEDERDLDPNAAAEYDRMVRTYQRVNAPDPVRLAYPNGASQLEAFGFDAGASTAGKAPASLVKKNAKPKKAAKK